MHISILPDTLLDRNCWRVWLWRNAHKDVMLSRRIAEKDSVRVEPSHPQILQKPPLCFT